MKFNFEGGKKKLLTTLGLAVTAAPAIAQGPSVEKSADQEFASNKNKIEYVKKGVNEEIGGGRKVKKVPEGYIKDRTEGNKTYYKKTTDGKKLELAKPGDGKGSEEYTNWLINMLKNGTSPEELAKMKYISPGAIEEYKKYYVPGSIDVVYTEEEENKAENPFSAYAEVGDILYGPDRHAIAEMFFPVRSTQNIEDAGNLNPNDQMVLIRIRNDWGFTGEYFEIPSSDMQKVFGTGKEVQNPELFNEWRKKAQESQKNKTYTLKAEDLAKNDKK